MTTTNATTIVDLLQNGKDGASAIIVPELADPVTFAELRRQVRDLAGQLNAMGIGRGDRVAIVLPNGPAMAIAFLAVASCATAAPLNPAYREEEFKFYLDDTSAKVLLLPPEGLD